MFSRIAHSILTLGFAACSTLASAQSGEENPSPDSAVDASEYAAFDSFLADFRERKQIPALTAVILRDGAVVWEGAYGWSDDEGDVAATPDTVFWIASVTKPVAATAIMAEAEAGRLDLATPMAADPGWVDICEWLTGSGIIFGAGGEEADGTPVSPTDCNATPTIADMLNMRVNTTAPEAFVYNPIAYARLDRVITGAGGRDLPDIVRDNVLTPAGMADTALGWRDEKAGLALQRLAPPFSVAGAERRKVAFPDDDFRAAAGMYTSVRQLANFDMAFDSGTLLSSDSMEAIAESPKTLPGYGYGWFNQQWNGHQLFWHSGWQPNAYSAIYLKLPHENLTLIVLANTEGLWWGNSLVRAEIEKSEVACTFLESFAVQGQSPD